MVRPICFMIMPYGTKDTQAQEGKGPARIDFDALWEKAFLPAIEAMGYQPVRADQDLGALIIQEMLERLALSDLVVADTTIPNGNVYYEVGVRHAAKERGCVLLGADWSHPLFDVDQMRRIRYPLPEESVSDETATRIRELLAAGVPQLAQGLSPIYQTLPGYPGAPDLQRATSFSKFMQEISAFQGKVTAVRRAPKEQRKERALALARECTGRVPLVHSLALEVLYLLRDCTDWQTTLGYVDGLPPELRDLPLVREQRALAQSKSGDHWQAIAGLEDLIATAGETSERRGLLGGRYKKLYLEAVKEGDAGEAVRCLDLAIESYDQGMRLDLNDYYPSCNLPRLYRARGEEGDEERAQAAAHIARIACERSRQRNPKDEWIRPTLLGAAFDAGDLHEAQRLVPEIRREGTAAWKLDTTLQDLEQALPLQRDPERRAGLEKLLQQLRGLL